MKLRDVLGFCPMGCGPTLHLTEVGSVVCTESGCPQPGAVSELLRDNETEHLVTLEGGRFTLRHPLRERLDGALENCPLHGWLQRQEERPMPPGRYRVRQLTRAERGEFWQSGWSWERLSA